MTYLKSMVLAAPLVAISALGAVANDYPTQSIQIIVPYSAGGGGDTVARLVSERLSEELGQQINVVNRPGAGGEIGIAEIAAADPDGYTLGIFGYPDNFVIESTREVSFSSDDLEFLAGFDATPMGIFASPNAPFTTLEELRAFATENPGGVVAGQSGALGLVNIFAFADGLGVELTPVAYSGGGELMNAVLGSHIELASTSSMSHDAITDAGGVPIGFAAAERMSMFPDVPTLAEQGVDLNVGVSRVMVAPAGIPDDVRDRLTAALDAISTDEDLIARFETASLPYAYLDHAAVNTMVEESNAVYGAIIEANRDQLTGN